MILDIPICHSDSNGKVAAAISGIYGFLVYFLRKERNLRRWRYKFKRKDVQDKVLSKKE